MAAEPGNPIVHTINAPSTHGWTVRQYRNGTWDATKGLALTIGFPTLVATLDHIDEVEGVADRPYTTVRDVLHDAAAALDAYAEPFGSETTTVEKATVWNGDRLRVELSNGDVYELAAELVEGAS